MTTIPTIPTEADYKKAFDTLDTNGDGRLDYNEFLVAMKEVYGDTDRDFHFIFDLYDEDRNGTIEYMEFRRVAIFYTDPKYAEQREDPKHHCSSFLI